MKPEPHFNAARRLDEAFGAPTSQVLLGALQSAHRHCEECIAELERVTACTERDAAAFTTARFRISNASLARRTIISRICDYLLELVDGRDAIDVRAIQQQQVDCARSSTDHVRKWPPGAIAGNWRLYCEDSRGVRAMMRQAIRAEQRTLYPMLARFTRG